MSPARLREHLGPALLAVAVLLGSCVAQESFRYDDTRAVEPEDAPAEGGATTDLGPGADEDAGADVLPDAEDADDAAGADAKTDAGEDAGEDATEDAADPGPACGEAPLCELQIGACEGSRPQPERCVDGEWQPCGAADYARHNPVYQVAPEARCDALDNDCDGETDEDLGGLCNCGDGTCERNGGETEETCPCDCDRGPDDTCDGRDNDCDGETDEEACDDGSVCTEDRCGEDGECVFEPAPDDTSCGDGDACNGLELCKAGECVAGEALDCDDGEPCTDDACDPVEGCRSEPNEAACEDGNACTEGDRCADGACVPGAPPDCDDGDPCTDDRCSISSGCEHTDNEADCDDGSPCTTEDYCRGGECFGGPPPDCDDGNPCTEDRCDPEDGCVNPPNAEPCDDGDECTVNEVCSGGTCGGGEEIPCDDDNPCTDDACDAGTGCTHTPNTEPCDDEEPCTTEDRCADGECVGGPPPSCNDNNLCTDDSCDAAAPGAGPDGCLSVPNERPCDDNDACTIGDVCSSGGCTGGGPQDCEDGNPCTDDGCDPGTGCVHTANERECDDGNECTSDDRCAEEKCKGVDTSLVDCDDGDPCTDDGCVPATGCTHEDNTEPCSDGDECTLGDRCEDGDCVGGPPPDCDDQDICTDDACDPEKGCTHDNNFAPCDDDNECTTGDECAGGTCKGFDTSEIDCEDSNPCTDPTCDPKTGCTYEHNTAPCDDTNPCTTEDACKDGGCVGGPPPDCDDNEVCTDDFCNETAGCDSVPNTLPCDDADECTDGDTCSGGSCQPGIVVSCDDELPCTLDQCDPKRGCVHLPQEGPCEDGNKCSKDDYCDSGACKPGSAVDCDDKDPCTDDHCNPDEGCSYTLNTAPCEDGDACTEGDTCDEGQCKTGDAVSCDDSNVCTDDDCESGTGCIHTNNEALCVDGDACTEGDTCKEGQCEPGPPADCDDSNPCTDDDCDSGTGCIHSNNDAACEDGDPCTTGDTCAIGGCVAGSGSLVCDDDNVCTDDSCTPGLGCVYTPNTAHCDDGWVCSTSDICEGGRCAGKGVLDCGAGYECTTTGNCDLVPTSLVLPEGFVLVPAGTFVMGSLAEEAGHQSDEAPVRDVQISRPLLVSKTKVTQAQWRTRFGTDPSHFGSCGDDCPVESVSWWEALAYCNSLSDAEGLEQCYQLNGCNGETPGEGLECGSAAFSGLDCTGYRLPTEAEWEYLTRAGTTTASYNGDLSDLDCASPEVAAIAWYCGNAEQSTHPVRLKKPNGWGLYDMLGEVWEWVWDRYGSEYYLERATALAGAPDVDPLGAVTGTLRTYRGCSWNSRARDCRAAQRAPQLAGLADRFLGFRPVRSLVFPELPDGSACGGAQDCKSGFCKDGVCCDKACTADCVSCGLAGKAGTCSNVPNGEEDADTCSGQSSCDGAGGCTCTPSCAGSACQSDGCGGVCGAETFAAESFESDNAGYVASAPDVAGGNNPDAAWQRIKVVDRASDGLVSFYFGDPVNHNMGGPGDARAQGTLLSPAFDIPTIGTTWAEMDLWMDTRWLDNDFSTGKPLGLSPTSFPEDHHASYMASDAEKSAVLLPDNSQTFKEDLLYIRVVDPHGGGFGVETRTNVWYSGYVFGFANSGFETVRVDLTPWAGSTVKLEWYFDTYFTPVNAHEGVYLDRVSLGHSCSHRATLECVGMQDCSFDGDLCTQNTCESHECGTTPSGAAGCP